MKANDHRWFLGAGVVAAVVASLCCIGPLVMLGLGLGSFAAASWFAEWRPLFLIVFYVQRLAVAGLAGLVIATVLNMWFLRRPRACDA